MPYISNDGWQFTLPPVLWFYIMFITYKTTRKGIPMIEVTRLNDSKLIINAELIEKVEEFPDTIITLTSGNKIIVKESRQEIKNLVVLYKKEILSRDL
jgi:flagellar protein FlbD